MRKILLVIQREYLTRVKKKSFWILTLLVPILLVALYAIPIYLATNSLEVTHVAVVDETGLYNDFHSSDDIVYHYMDDFDTAAVGKSDTVDVMLYIPRPISGVVPTETFVYFKNDAPSPSVKSDMDRQCQDMLRNNILLDVYNINRDDYEQIKNTSVKMHVQDLDTGESDFSGMKMAIGLVLSLLISFAIFMFGTQVMRGVMEEKTNRIVEVLVSSLKPFQLMMGKVVGVALVGLTQFTLWIVLSGSIIMAFTVANADTFDRARQQEQIEMLRSRGVSVEQLSAEMPDADTQTEMVQGLLHIQYGAIAIAFLIFFILGYLLYSTLFAAVGAITESEQDNSQFVLPLTVPLLLVIILTPTLIEAPNGSLAMWLSMIPFTSPVAMMVRVPFGVPVWQILASVGILLLTIILAVWVAAKIYRTGILLYGKKITYKEIWKWLKFRS